MYRENSYKDIESVDFEFFNSDDGQIDLHTSESFREGKIVTKAIVETYRDGDCDENCFKKENTIMDNENTKSTLMKVANLISGPAFNKYTNNERLLTNCLAFTNESHQENEKYTENITFDNEDCSDSSSEFSLTNKTSDLTSVSPCSLISDFSIEVNDNKFDSQLPQYENNFELNCKSLSDDIASNLIPSSYETDVYFDLNAELNAQKEPLCFETDSNPKKSVKEDEDLQNLSCHKLNDPINDKYDEDIETLFNIEKEFGGITLSDQSSISSCKKKPSLNKRLNEIRFRRKDKNLTFKREELIKIERDNLILLKKIMSQSKPRTISLNQPFSHKKTSAAINRAKQHKKIEQENYILHSKISAIGRMKSVF